MTEALKRIGADLKARINAIFANRIGVSLTLPKRIVVAAAAVVSPAPATVNGRRPE